MVLRGSSTGPSGHPVIRRGSRTEGALKILWLDLSAGVSGDMLLGALAELGGAPEASPEGGPVGGMDALRAAVEALGVPGLRVERREVVRCGIGASKIDVLLDGALAQDPGHIEPLVPAGPAPSHGRPRAHGHDHPHEHDHAHHDDSPHDHDTPHDPAPSHHEGPAHSHRTLAEIIGILERSRLADPVRARALAVFRRLVEAESSVHRIPPDEVRLHEAGALDAIADVAGVCALVERLRPDRILASPVNVGGGFMDIAHGRYPVPGPAASRLLQGCAVFSSGPEGELATPTGAALVATLAEGFGPLPPMRLLRMGIGAGSRDTAPRPNVLRALLGEDISGEARAERPGVIDRPGGGPARPDVAVVECTVDDMNPQNYGWLQDRLRAAGALDCWLTAIQMKKGRPGVAVTILCPPAMVDAVGSVLFAETTTIGFRWRLEHRRELERAFEQVETVWGPVRVKVSSEAGVIRTAQPEYEDCRKLAEASGVPLKDVQAAALDAWRRGRAGGSPR